MIATSHPAREGVFTLRFEVRWGEVDFNSHMRNTAYLEICPTVRMSWFRSQGIAMRDFERLRFGPVVLRDAIEYFRELRLLDVYDVTLALAGLSADGAKCRMRNEFHDEGGTLVARVTSLIGWMNLATRKLAPPPEPIPGVMGRLTRTADFAPV